MKDQQGFSELTATTDKIIDELLDQLAFAMSMKNMLNQVAGKVYNAALCDADIEANSRDALLNGSQIYLDDLVVCRKDFACIAFEKGV